MPRRLLRYAAYAIRHAAALYAASLLRVRAAMRRVRSKMRRVRAGERRRVRGILGAKECRVRRREHGMIYERVSERGIRGGRAQAEAAVLREARSAPRAYAMICCRALMRQCIAAQQCVLGAARVVRHGDEAPPGWHHVMFRQPA